MGGRGLCNPLPYIPVFAAVVDVEVDTRESIVENEVIVGSRCCFCLRNDRRELVKIQYPRTGAEACQLFAGEGEIDATDDGCGFENPSDDFVWKITDGVSFFHRVGVPARKKQYRGSLPGS